jgi:catechol 2,3-dioxygenase-like lactoylglutathione lyase family enzyme
MLSVRGLFETHLTVRDLERSIAFYRDVVGLAPAHLAPERRAAFLWIGGRGRGMLGLWSIGTSPLGQHLHFSMAMALEELVAAPARLRAAGVPPRDGDEPVVIGWMPAASVFFEDPDGHSVELISVLPHEPRPDVSWIPLSKWMNMQHSGRSRDIEVL